MRPPNPRKARLTLQKTQKHSRNSAKTAKNGYFPSCRLYKKGEGAFTSTRVFERGRKRASNLVGGRPSQSVIAEGVIRRGSLRVLFFFEREPLLRRPGLDLRSTGFQLRRLRNGSLLN